MNEAELIATIEHTVKPEVQCHLGELPLHQMASLDAVEGLCRRLVMAAARLVLDAWKDALEQVVRTLTLACPKCGATRKCKRRPGQPMQLRLLGLEVALEKLYLECDCCDAPGVSITRLLTGLSSGDASMELKLVAAYCAAQQSYGKASSALAVHHGQEVERTWLRRQSLQVERMAKAHAERGRAQALRRISGEGRVLGADRLMLQGDGGSVRTGQLVACEPGDPGYGKTTAKTHKPRRKRPELKREIITLDVRQPGAMEATGLDVVVPVEAPQGVIHEPVNRPRGVSPTGRFAPRLPRKRGRQLPQAAEGEAPRGPVIWPGNGSHLAPQGERARRMLALAARQGLGDNTQVLGLGDLGSRLPQSFDEAFCGYESLYCGDWNHVRGYVTAAAEQLEGLDNERWQTEMRTAIWERDLERRNALLVEARRRRVLPLPKDLVRCPLDALESYLCNNWDRMHAARLKEMGVDFVSARAESQVRDRTKSRFAVPGAWRQENLEGKATLKAIIDDGRFDDFRRDCLERSQDLFEKQLADRIKQALGEGRISQCQADALLSCSAAGQSLDLAA